MVEIGTGTLMGIFATIFFGLMSIMATFLYKISVNLTGIEGELKRVNENLGNKLDNIDKNTREANSLLHRIAERTKNNNDKQTDGGETLNDDISNNAEEERNTLLLEEIKDSHGNWLFDDTNWNTWESIKEDSDLSNNLKKLSEGHRFNDSDIIVPDVEPVIDENWEIREGKIEIDVKGVRNENGFIFHILASPKPRFSSNRDGDFRTEIYQIIQQTAEGEFGEATEMANYGGTAIVTIDKGTKQEVREWIRGTIDLLERYYSEYEFEFDGEEV